MDDVEARIRNLLSQPRVAVLAVARDRPWHDVSIRVLLRGDWSAITDADRFRCGGPDRTRSRIEIIADVAAQLRAPKPSAAIVGMVVAEQLSEAQQRHVADAVDAIVTMDRGMCAEIIEKTLDLYGPDRSQSPWPLERAALLAFIQDGSPVQDGGDAIAFMIERSAGILIDQILSGTTQAVVREVPWQRQEMAEA